MRLLERWCWRERAVKGQGAGYIGLLRHQDVLRERAGSRDSSPERGARPRGAAFWDVRSAPAGDTRRTGAVPVRSSPLCGREPAQLRLERFCSALNARLRHRCRPTCRLTKAAHRVLVRAPAGLNGGRVLGGRDGAWRGIVTRAQTDDLCGETWETWSEAELRDLAASGNCRRPHRPRDPGHPSPAPSFAFHSASSDRPFHCCRLTLRYAFDAHDRRLPPASPSPATAPAGHLLPRWRHP